MSLNFVELGHFYGEGGNGKGPKCYTRQKYPLSKNIPPIYLLCFDYNSLLVIHQWYCVAVSWLSGLYQVWSTAGISPVENCTPMWIHKHLSDSEYLCVLRNSTIPWIFQYPEKYLYYSCTGIWHILVYCIWYMWHILVFVLVYDTVKFQFQGSFSPIIPRTPKFSSHFIFHRTYTCLSNPFPSKPSIVSSTQKQCQSHPSYSSWWLGIFGCLFQGI